jgi:hypothetical protein
MGAFSVMDVARQLCSVGAVAIIIAAKEYVDCVSGQRSKLTRLALGDAEYIAMHAAPWIQILSASLPVINVCCCILTS